MLWHRICVTFITITGLFLKPFFINFFHTNEKSFIYPHSQSQQRPACCFVQPPPPPMGEPNVANSDIRSTNISFASAAADSTMGHTNLADDNLAGVPTAVQPKNQNRSMGIKVFYAL